VDEATDAARTVRCPSCGLDVRATDRFCTACGTAIVPDEDAAGGEVTEAGAGPRHDATTVLPKASTGDRATTTARPGGPAATATRCPNCGTDNATERELCSRCGVDLATGEQLPTIASVDAGELESASGGISRRIVLLWAVAVLAVLAVVGAVVLGLYLAQVGPFADPDAPLDPVDFSAGAYPGDPELLPLESIASVTARSPEGGRSFTPEHLVDGDPDTAWHGDPAALPAGVTEKIDLMLDGPAWVTTVVVGNGDQLDPDAYQDTARLSRAVLHLDGGLAYELVLLDLGLELQAVELPEPVLTTAVRLELLESVGDDAVGPALSRIDLRGFVADVEDAALAEERADQRPAAGPISLTVGRSS
jgi:ribosomal protein L32